MRLPLIDVNVSQLSDILTWRQKRPVCEKINGHRILSTKEHSGEEDCISTGFVVIFFYPRSRPAR